MNKLIQYLPKQAQARLASNEAALLVDVRCEAEHKFVGRPMNCILVPWLDDPTWEVNEEAFIAAIKRFNCQLNTEVILICRSGYRSEEAGKCLIKFGFSHVAHVVSGFEGDLDEHNQRGNVNGWRHDGLKWEQC